eukprot:TRINITY_DN11382_c0_g3_i11.p2 TRINITY_DN11382_c0_g3~~TRINITY_DN11382_c0_g3_i11.p2  ORF type:complete len:139 (+),score=9.91 TRINITY_DN11382_c0_g3_i11:987-1403(+)
MAGLCVQLAGFLSLARSVTPLTTSITIILGVNATLLALAWMAFKNNFDSIKQLALYLTSAGTDLLNLVVYYYLHLCQSLVPDTGFLSVSGLVHAGLRCGRKASNFSISSGLFARHTACKSFGCHHPMHCLHASALNID